ncbi:MAG: hypothetical protein R3C26_09400 [Calditrichia bacterium]
MKLFNLEWNNFTHQTAAKWAAEYLSDVPNLINWCSPETAILSRVPARRTNNSGGATRRSASCDRDRETCVLRKIAAEPPLPVPQLSIYTPRHVRHLRCTTRLLAMCSPGKFGKRPLGCFSAGKSCRRFGANFLKALHSIPVEIADDCELLQLDEVTVAANLSAAAAKISYLLNPQSRSPLAETLENGQIHRQTRKSGNRCSIAISHRDICFSIRNPVT